MRCLRGWSVVGDDRLLLAIQLCLATLRLLGRSTHGRHRHRIDDRYGVSRLITMEWLKT